MGLAVGKARVRGTSGVERGEWKREIKDAFLQTSNFYSFQVR
jgi:hypothetical protein